MGSTELTAALFKTIASPDETILLTNPTYVNYFNQLHLELGGRYKIATITVLSEKFNFLPAVQPSETLDKFHEIIDQKKPRILIFPSPDNPTSQIWPNKVIDELLQLTADYNMWFIIDFAYRAIYFTQKPKYYSFTPKEYPNLITIHSFSKSFSLLGLRVGYIIADPLIISGLEVVEQCRNLCADTLHQIVLERFLNRTHIAELKKYFDAVRKQYKTTANSLVEGLRENIPNIKILEPQGGFYVVANIEIFGYSDSWKFMTDLRDKYGVLVVPGIAFGTALNKGIRISFAPYVRKKLMLEEGIKRLSAFYRRCSNV
jgi:aminotransferase